VSSLAAAPWHIACLTKAMTSRPPAPEESRDATIVRGLVSLARAGFKGGHAVPFGAQVNSTRSGRVLVKALNRVVKDCDPTAHAEVRAIRLACRKVGRPNLSGYTLYTTCEPCAMCLTAALFSGLDRVVYGTVVRRPDATGPRLYDYEAKRFASASLFKTKVDGPVEETLCRALVDDPKVTSYIRRQGKKGILI